MEQAGFFFLSYLKKVDFQALGNLFYLLFVFWKGDARPTVGTSFLCEYPGSFLRPLTTMQGVRQKAQVTNEAQDVQGFSSQGQGKLADVKDLSRA